MLMLLAVVVAFTCLQGAMSNVELDIDFLGVRHKKTPLFLECVGNVAFDLESGIYYRAKDEKPPSPTGPWRGTPFTGLLHTIATEKKGHHVVFIVRPDGLKTFELLRAILVLRNRAHLQEKISYGTELVPRSWNILTLRGEKAIQRSKALAGEL